MSKKKLNFGGQCKKSTKTKDVNQIFFIEKDKKNVDKVKKVHLTNIITSLDQEVKWMPKSYWRPNSKRRNEMAYEEAKLKTMAPVIVPDDCH